MKSFMGEKNYFEFDSLRNWKPVQFEQNRGDVVEYACRTCNKSSRCILYGLELFNNVFGDTV